MGDLIGYFWQLFNQGFDLTGIALFVNRLAVGVFFAISGYHQLFLAERHASLVDTLEDDGIKFIWLFQWLVPLVEFLGGIALIIGFMAPLAGFAILVIMTVAIITDGSKRVIEFAPVDKADALDDVLYLSETTYWIMALIIILAGPGSFSLHNVLMP